MAQPISTSFVQRFNPAGMQFPGMSQAVRCGDWIMVSGQVAVSNGRVIGVGDAVAQAQQCFDNLQNALREAGGSLEDVVNLRCYLTDRSAYTGYAEIKNHLFGSHPPCSTVVVVKELLLPDLLMEVEATAWVGHRQSSGVPTS